MDNLFYLICIQQVISEIKVMSLLLKRSVLRILFQYHLFNGRAWLVDYQSDRLKWFQKQYDLFRQRLYSTF